MHSLSCCRAALRSPQLHQVRPLSDASAADCTALVCSAAAMGWEPERGKELVTPLEGGGQGAEAACTYSVVLQLDDGSGLTGGWDDDDFLGDGAVACAATAEAMEDLLDAAADDFGRLGWDEQRRRLNALLGRPRLWTLTRDPRHGGWRIDASVPVD